MNKPYDANEELVAMKQDIADRTYNISIKQMLIPVIGAVVGGAIGILLAPATAGASLMPALIGSAVGFFGGKAAADFATMKDREKLKIDQEMVDSYMQGKNYWGEGYREEVAEHGYSLGGPLPPSAPPPPSRDKGRHT